MINAFDSKCEMLDLTEALSSRKEQSVSIEFEPNGAWLSGTPYEFCGNGTLSLTINPSQDWVEIKGCIKIPTNFVCDRCAGKFQENLFIEFDEKLTETQDDEHFTIINNKVNINEIIENIVASNIPLSVLCNPKCKGLCASCGQNLNDGSCDCKNEVRRDNPFASLKGKFN